jgi:ABC-type multidrug transport system fused ATPase/permease subunit
MRRTLVAVIFNKVCNLSMKSLIATNSGKLISVISADLFAAERSLTFTPLILAFLPVNAFAYMIIGFTSTWYNSLIVFCVWVVMLLFQIFSGHISKSLKMKDSALNDERLKLINDMVVGVRTLKSYGWENHYLNKITAVRKKQ